MEKDRVIWIDVMRGLAIFAVVVCHQQGLLHRSEVIQCATLYSVSSLIFLMGITKGMSLEKYRKRRFSNEESRPLWGYTGYTLKSLSSVIAPYFFVTYIIVRGRGGGNMELLQALVECSASVQFYYVAHIIRFAILSLPLYAVWKWILGVEKYNIRVLLSVLFLLLTWIIGYYSIGRIDVFGQSYLFIYSAGLMISLVGMPKLSKSFYVAEMVLLILGVYAISRFYFARVDGNYSYSEFIDVIDPMLQMNPPNISTILYSVAIVFGVYIVVLLLTLGERKPIFLKPICLLGKYSLDIFLWHLYVREMWSFLFGIPENIWVRRVLFYGIMFFVPILVRKMYTIFIIEKLYEPIVG